MNRPPESGLSPDDQELAIDWRQLLAAYNHAKASRERAAQALQDVLASLDLDKPGTSQPHDARLMGGELARMREARESRGLRQATSNLTQGRPLYQALWSLPVDI
jgi:hypothetical protein